MFLISASNILKNNSDNFSFSLMDLMIKKLID